MQRSGFGVDDDVVVDGDQKSVAWFSTFPSRPASLWINTGQDSR